MIIYKWVKEWFNPAAFGSNNGTSLSRRLMTFLVIACATTLAFDGIKRGVSASWAVAATGLATTLAGLWWSSRPKTPQPQPKPPTQE